MLSNIHPLKHIPEKWAYLLVLITSILLISSVIAIQRGYYTETRNRYPVKHIIVIMQENHSFDNYFGTFPGVIGGYSNNTCIYQTGYSGCIHPYHLTSRILPRDLCHGWECMHQEYANGTNSGFYMRSGILPFGYYDYRDIPYYWQLARNYTLLDNYFSSVMGPTLPNHLYLVAGQSGGVISNIRDLRGLHGHINLNIKSIFEVLTDHHISWSSYSWKSPVNWNAPALLPRVANNETLFKNVKYPYEFFRDVRENRLAQVSWIMPPSDEESEHPPYDVRLGEKWVKGIIDTIRSSNYWASSAIILTYDESGGFFDIIPPPQVDEYGYGFRVPAIVISPFSKHGFIDHTQYDHTSVLRFIETIFNLEPLSERDAKANNLLNSFNFPDSSRTIYRTCSFLGSENNVQEQQVVLRMPCYLGVIGEPRQRELQYMI